MRFLVFFLLLAGLAGYAAADAVAKIATDRPDRTQSVNFGFSWGWGGGGGRYWKGGNWWGGNGGWYNGGNDGRYYQGWNPGYYPGYNGGGNVAVGWVQVGWGAQGRFFWRVPWGAQGYWGGGCWGCGVFYCQGCNHPTCPSCQYWDPYQNRCIPAYNGCGSVPDCGVCSFFDPSYNNNQGACIQAQGCGQQYGCSQCYNPSYNDGYGNNYGNPGGGGGGYNPGNNGGGGGGYNPGNSGNPYGRKMMEEATAQP